MASPNPEIPHQNSKPSVDVPPVVVHPVRATGMGEGKRFLFTFLICSVLSSVIHVILFTMFLFVVDIIWIKVLSAPGIQVLLIDPKQAQKEQQETAKW